MMLAGSWNGWLAMQLAWRLSAQARSIQRIHYRATHRAYGKAQQLITGPDSWYG